MKIDLRQHIVDYQGRPVMEAYEDPSEPGKQILKPRQLREYSSFALNNAAPSEVITPEDKNRAYAISVKLFAGNTIDLSLEQATLLKERILKMFISPLHCGRLIDILEKRTPEKVLPEEDLKAAASTPEAE